MAQSFEASDANLVLTLDEITSLTEDGSKPAETLMNVAALIAARFKTDVCSAYLLEPDRSNLVLAATLGLHPRSIGALRMPLSEGLVGLVAEQVRPVAVEDAGKHPRYKYFKESGEEEYHSFLGVPLIDRGMLQGVLVVQTKEPRVFRDHEIRMLSEAADQLAPVVSEARTVDRFIAPAQERLWALARNVCWSWDHECINLFRDLNPVRWRELNQNPISLLNEMPLQEIERRAAELVLHSRINYVYRRQQEYLQADRTWGARMRACCGTRPVAYFSAEFGMHESLPIYSGGLGVLSGDHIKSASDLDIPLVALGCSTARGTSCSGWIRTAGSRKSICRRTSINSRCSRRSESTASRWWWRSPRAAARFAPRCGDEGGALRSAAAGLKRGRQRAGRPGYDLTTVRRGLAHAHPAGAAAGRGRLSRAESDGHYARACST